MTGAPNQAELEAARLVLDRMGVTTEDLLNATRPPATTFAEYIPVVAAAVSDGIRRAYGPYWNRVLDQWANISLSDGHSDTNVHRSDSRGAEDLVDQRGVLGVSVPDEESDSREVSSILEVHEQVADGLGDPGMSGVRGDAEYVHTSAGVVNSARMY
jgi:hypothetical protein